MTTLFHLAAMVLYAGFAIGCAAETIDMLRSKYRFDALIGGTMTVLLALGFVVHGSMLVPA